MWLHNLWMRGCGVHVDYGCKSPEAVSARTDSEARLERADFKPARTPPAPRAREGARHPGDAFARHGRTEAGENHLRLQAPDESGQRCFAPAAARTRPARIS